MQSSNAIQSSGVNIGNIYYKDAALIRERLKEKEKGFLDGQKDEVLRIVSDNRFTNVFLTRATHSDWQQIIYIQTNIKSKFGCGT